ncbi:unnamed protein product [Bursaphelenchus xylophilus]|uniref:(pine wood nematode) hypothetical protein n=1 Tax=Bursaphelenchus xylophilus TaxID=6326 RepID=A0A1I7SQU1_BURXY|nr:unnamed protein product [Bursaphelenchus xylophilus]CAG9110384.1 unnamed protein product [Bursaphelenchus xylophilus]
MLLRWLCLLTALASAQDLDKYYGIPLSGVHLSSDATSGELYAYDEYTIFFNHLNHAPKIAGCTAMMLGPPRPQDKGHSLIPGHGVIVPVAQINDAPFDDGAPVPVVFDRNLKRKVALKRRLKRNINRIFGNNLFNWPVQMDHLLIAPGKNKLPGASVTANSFNGIHIQRGTKNLTETEINITPVSSSTSSTTQTTTTTSTTSAPTSSTAPSTTSSSSSQPSSTSTGPSTSPSTTPPSVTSATPASTTVRVETSSQRTHGQQLVVQAKMTPVPVKSTRLEALNKKSEKGALLSDVLAISNAPVSETSTRASTTTLTSPTTEKQASTTTTASPTTPRTTQPTTRVTVTRKLAIKTLPPSTTSTASSKPPRVLKTPFSGIPDSETDEFDSEFPDVLQIPARSQGEYKLDVHYSDLIQKLGEDSNEFRRAPAREQKSRDKDEHEHTWKVVEDPHKDHRERVLKQLLAEEGTSQFIEPSRKIIPLDKTLALPEIHQKQVFFAIQNGAKLSDYHWFGLYDHCEQRHLKLVSLRGVDPPREERIMPLSGWSNGISSYRVHILNCNTILIPGFTFEPGTDARNSFFVAGIGDFPDQIEKQVKISIVGEQPNKPLRRYENEDVLLRLPHTYRTFDIDFISVYNMDTQKSMAHVIIPSLLVPPCQED